MTRTYKTQIPLESLNCLKGFSGRHSFLGHWIRNWEKMFLVEQWACALMCICMPGIQSVLKGQPFLLHMTTTEILFYTETLMFTTLKWHFFFNKSHWNNSSFQRKKKKRQYIIIMLSDTEEKEKSTFWLFFLICLSVWWFSGLASPLTCTLVNQDCLRNKWYYSTLNLT